MATPAACAARARRRLICAPRSTPPVMHEMTIGAASGRPKSSDARVDVVEVELRERLVHESIALEAGREVAEANVLLQGDPDVVGLAARVLPGERSLTLTVHRG